MDFSDISKNVPSLKVKVFVNDTNWGAYFSGYLPACLSVEEALCQLTGNLGTAVSYLQVFRMCT